MSLFPADRNHLYPIFETYRLRALDPDTDVRGHALPSAATQSRTGYDQALSFNEVRARISWNHVAVHGSRGLYVDVDWNVIAFELDDDLTPTFAKIATVQKGKAEFPCVAAVDDTHWAVTSDSLVYVLRTSPPGSPLDASIVATYNVGSPVLVHGVHAVAGRAVLLLTRTVRQGEGSRYKARQTEFELGQLEVDLAAQGESSSAVEWVLKGADLPVWATWHGGWVILTSAAYSPIIVETAETPGAGAADSVTGDSTSGDLADVEMAVDSTAPYQWTQDTTSLNVVIPLHGATRADLSLTSTAFAGPLGAREWWADIDPSASTWTFHDGVLDLDLAKADEDTRWPQVFSDDDDVAETLSAGLLAAVRESFQVQTREPGEEPAGGHPAMPALLREEMDYDEDEVGDGEDFAGKVGRDVVVGFWASPTPLGAASASAPPAASWSRQSAAVLSLPLLGQSVIVKSGVDGLHFDLPRSNDPSAAPWTHVTTSPALAFVISSKRDIRCVRHVAGRVIALEAGGIGTGNAYIYYPPDSKLTASQGVVAVSGGERGALLGVGAATVSGREVVVALCENELVLITA